MKISSAAFAAGVLSVRGLGLPDMVVKYCTVCNCQALRRELFRRWPRNLVSVPREAE